MELTPAQRQLFDDVNFAVISTVNPDGGPQSSVVWCKTDGDDVLISTVEGRRKHVNMLADNRVAILVYPSDAPYTYVEIRGTVTMSYEGGRELIDELAAKYRGVERYTADDGTENVRVVVRISPQKVFSRGV